MRIARLARAAATALQIAVVMPVVCPVSAQAPPARSFDVVIYGGTAGGVVTAISAARMGLSVALIEPTRHIGGMVTGGLSATDHGEKIVTGGDALAFYRRIGAKYGVPLFWYPEPKVAESVLHEMLAEQKNVQLFMRHRLREQGSVRKNGANIVELVTENGARFRGKLFVEASYEGDLMRQAGVSYTVGRESSAKYDEGLAGVRPKDRNHQFDYTVSARDANGRLLPEISPLPRGEIGAGDNRVQAYNFRLILTTEKANQVPFERPAGYTPRRYELLRRFIDVVQRERGTPPTLNELLLIRADLPHSKADFNNRGPFSTDYIGASYGYPDGTYAERARIWREHVLYTKGLLYFLATDPSLPASIRTAMNEWGLAKDEFTDNGNWPYQLYIREGRRMVGDFVMAQKDLQTELTKPDAIAMGSYNSDSHNVQRFVQPDGSAQNEGNMEVRVEPYQIPYRIMLPRRTEAANLLVPVPFSASHVVYSSMRMEPQYMMIGQAAGVAAALALRHHVGVHDVDVAELRRILKGQGMTDVYDPAAAPAVAREPRDGVMLAFENFADIFGSRLHAAFDSIPAARYEYRPTPSQQTVGYIAQHLESANYWLCEQFGDLKHPTTAKDSLADTVKARWPKDTLVARLQASLRFCDTALERVGKLESGPKARTLLAFETDLAEHYSQIAGYMRLLGMVPPSALPPRRRSAIELPTSALSPYVGVYQIGPDLQFDVTTRDGALFVRSSWNPAVRLWPESGQDFFLKDVDAQVTFTRDASGVVTGLIVHQFGRDRSARKIR